MIPTYGHEIWIMIEKKFWIQVNEMSVARFTIRDRMRSSVIRGKSKVELLVQAFDQDAPLRVFLLEVFSANYE